VSHQGLDQLEGRAEYLQVSTLILIIIAATSHKSRAIWKIAETVDTLVVGKKIVSSIFYFVGAGRVDDD
jgi:hypothetical protein